MVVPSQTVLEDISHIKTCKPKATLFTGIPVVDLLDPRAGDLIVTACLNLGFFKVVNHGVPIEFMTSLEQEALGFFNLSQSEKDRALPPCSLGYGSKRIGTNGDVGWVEYLLFSMDPNLISHKYLSLFPGDGERFWGMVRQYVGAVREMAREVLEMMAEGLGMEDREVWSRMVKEERSDSCFRVNHYPPCPELRALSGRNLVGFGEHTDPQIISVVRSNNTAGLQISLRDGTWVSVPPDHQSLFINVGDLLQVMTNGRFKSVKHRVVVTEGLKSRLSMIYFGGPPLCEKIAPLSPLMEEGEESLYNEFTWCEYKNSAYKTRLGDNRLLHYEKLKTKSQ